MGGTAATLSMTAETKHGRVAARCRPVPWELLSSRLIKERASMTLGHAIGSGRRVINYAPTSITTASVLSRGSVITTRNWSSKRGASVATFKPANS